MQNFRFGMAFAIVLFSFVHNGASLAQSAADRRTAASQAEQIRRQEAQDERLRLDAEARARAQQTIETEEPPTRQAVLPDSGQCLDIEVITVKGVKVFRPSRIELLKKPFEGRCLSLTDLNRILELYTLLYTQAGYITARAYLPEQETADRELEISIVEGQLRAIKINGKLVTTADLYTLFPGMLGKVLNLRDIEQGLDQIKRLPSNKASILLEPGEKLGDTVLAVKVEKSKPWRATYHIDNLGTESTGKYKSKFSAGFDGLLGFNEGINVSYDRSVSNSPFNLSGDRPNGNNYTGSLSLPLGYWTFNFSGGYSNYESTVRGQISTVNTEGNTTTGSITASKLFARTQTTKSLLDLSVNYSKSENYILGSLLEASSRTLSNVTLKLLHSYQVWRGAASFSLTLHKGVDWFGAVENNELPAQSPKAQFNKLSFSTSYYKPFSLLGYNLSFNGEFSGQTSEELLFGNDQISLGGLSSVRGTTSSLIFGNKGLLWRSELALQLGTEKLGARFNEVLGTLEPYVAFDWGTIKSQQSYDIEGGSLIGLTVGLRNKQGRVLFDLAYADIVNGPKRLSEEVKKSGVFYATLSVNF